MFGFLGSLGLSAKIALAAGVVIALMGTGFALYYRYSQNQLAELNQSIGIEKVAREVAEKSLETAYRQVQTQTREMGRLADEMARARAEQERIIDIFAEHDLNALAAAKPGLIETRVNNGTRNIIEQLERITQPETYKVEDQE